MNDTPVRRAFERHDAFETAGDGEFAGTATAFDARARGGTAAEMDVEGDDEWAFLVTVHVPMLGSAVEGEVGDAVEDGWYETLELRLEDAYDVARDAAGDVGVDRDGDEVRVRFAYTARDPRQGVDDAAALVDFVEGTYIQGVIPGYDYTDPVAGLVDRARQQGSGDGGPTAGP